MNERIVIQSLDPKWIVLPILLGVVLGVGGGYLAFRQQFLEDRVQRLESVEADNSNLNQRLEDLEDRENNLLVEREELLTRVSDLRLQLSELNSTLSAKETENRIQLAQIEILAFEISSTRQQISEILLLVEELESEVLVRESLLDEMREAIAASEDRVRLLEIDLSEALRKLDPSTPDPGFAIVFQDNFEYAGSLADQGWIPISLMGEVETQSVVVAQGARALKIFDTSQSGGIELHQPLELILRNFKVDFFFRASGNYQRAEFIVRGSEGIVDGVEKGILVRFDEQPTRSFGVQDRSYFEYDLERWYHIRIIVQPTRNVFALYVDDMVNPLDVAVPFSDVYFDRIIIQTSDLGTGTTLWDGILVQEERVVGEFILELEAKVDGHLLSANQGCPAVWEDRPRNTHDPFIFFGSEDLGRCYRGFAAWDISSIPDGARILDLLFRYDGDPRLGNPPSTAQIRGVLDDECTRGDFVDSNLWMNLRDGGDANPIYVTNWTPQEVSQSEIDLGQRAERDLEQSLRNNNQFCISFSLDTESAGTTISDLWAICATEGDCAPAPTLVVGYETTSRINDTGEFTVELRSIVDGHMLSANQGCPGVWEERPRNTHDPIFAFGSADQGRCYRAFVAWDISVIPDGSVITNLQFRYNGNPRTGNPPSTGQIRGVLDDECKAEGSLDSTLWMNLRDGGEANPVYVTNWTPQEVPGSDVELGETAQKDLEMRLASSQQFCLSFTLDIESSGNITSDHWNICASEANCSPAPTLVVDYEVPTRGNGTALVVTNDDGNGEFIVLSVEREIYEASDLVTIRWHWHWHMGTYAMG